MKVVVHHDERGAGFAAVGYARAVGRAAVVVTTSGTAVANLLPAVVESAQAGLPLVLLTADRAPESRLNGANQAITQVSIGALSLHCLHDYQRLLITPSDSSTVQHLL